MGKQLECPNFQVCGGLQYMLDGHVQSSWCEDCFLNLKMAARFYLIGLTQVWSVTPNSMWTDEEREAYQMGLADRAGYE